MIERSGGELSGRVAVVTGASRGVGRHIAVALAGQGAATAVVARSADALDATCREIAEAGGTAIAVPADVTDADAVEALREEVTRRLGVPTILVNAAGQFGPVALIHEADPADWIETLMVNTVAPYRAVRAFLPGMREAGWGRIVNVTSAAALHPPGPLNSAYGTSKVALNQFTRHLAAELEGSGITANVFHPGDVKTEMWADIRDQVAALGPVGEAYERWVEWVEETGGDPPEKAAALVLRLVGDDAASVNGQFLWIEDGLQPRIPSWGEDPDARPW
jgi:NAD(P)-dependent dehydrogenase (short-subunit alcohol dehydrogenase family)